MLIVIDMENGKTVRCPVATEAESRKQPPVARPAPYLQAQPIPQPHLQEVSFPPRAACPPPSLGVIDVPLSAFDA